MSLNSSEFYKEDTIIKLKFTVQVCKLESNNNTFEFFIIVEGWLSLQYLDKWKVNFLHGQ